MSSLRTQVKKAISKGIVALGDLAQRGTYTSVGTPTYNATTGASTTPSTDYANLRMVFSNFKRMEIDGEAVRQEDQKVLVAALDLVPVPTVNDRITDELGAVWNVIGIMSVPGTLIWTLHVRHA